MKGRQTCISYTHTHTHIPLYRPLSLNDSWSNNILQSTVLTISSKLVHSHTDKRIIHVHTYSHIYWTLKKILVTNCGVCVVSKHNLLLYDFYINIHGCDFMIVVIKLSRENICLRLARSAKRETITWAQQLKSREQSNKCD